MSLQSVDMKIRSIMTYLQGEFSGTEGPHRTFHAKITSHHREGPHPLLEFVLELLSEKAQGDSLGWDHQFSYTYTLAFPGPRAVGSDDSPRRVPDHSQSTLFAGGHRMFSSTASLPPSLPW